jgi:hypothetical protein
LDEGEAKAKTDELNVKIQKAWETGRQSARQDIEAAIIRWDKLNEHGLALGPRPTMPDYLDKSIQWKLTFSDHFFSYTGIEIWPPKSSPNPNA